MGVNPTPSNFKTFTFDNTNSAQYGVYITGQGVFNAPERNVEMVEIPGRDGAYALDKGNFNNIEVTYPAGIVADTEADFATAVSNLRNFLCSKTGYCRLTDDYNSGEYRMAIYKSGLEVDHEGLKTGEFNIVFECKPQRWLTSGETAVNVASGGTLTNPTLFEAKPLLKVAGYGDLLFNNYKINVSQANTLGYYKVMENVNLTPHSPIHIDSALTNTGDTIILNNTTFSITLVDVFGTKFNSVGNVSSHMEVDVNTRGVISIRYSHGNISHTAGNTEYVSYSGTFNVYAYDENNTLQGAKIVFSTHLDYISSDNGKLELTGLTWRTEEITGVPLLNLDLVEGNAVVFIEEISVNSSVLLSTTELNIDMDIGEAYFAISNYIIKANKFVSLGADLPKLQSGNNLFTYDNTITSLSVVPKWWRV